MTRSLTWMRPALAGLGIVISAACGHDEMSRPAAETGGPAEVALATASVVEWPSTYEAGGVVRARRTAVVAARVVAPVLDVRVAAGDRVRHGQTLIVLDGRELQAQAARASAGASGATLALQAAQAEQRAAEAALTLARATHARIRGLREKNSATAQELDEAVAALAGAEARAAAAAARVAEAEQGIAAARAAEQAAQVGASYAVLTAPFDGVVTARHVDPGSLAAPGVPLVTIDDASSYRLEVRLDESHARLVAVGDAAEVRIDAGTGDAAGGWQQGRIAEIAAIDPARHSFLTKLDLPRGEAVRSGQFGRVRFRGPARPTLAVPSTAVVRRGQLSYVFAVDGDGAARLRMVSVGESSGDRVEVLAGLEAGERIVAAPPAGLQDGRRVIGAGDRP